MRQRPPGARGRRPGGPNFAWSDPTDDRKPEDLLRAEGVEVTDGVVSPGHRLTTDELEHRRRQHPGRRQPRPHPGWRRQRQPQRKLLLRLEPARRPRQRPRPPCARTTSWSTCTATAATTCCTTGTATPTACSRAAPGTTRSSPTETVSEGGNCTEPWNRLDADRVRGGDGSDTARVNPSDIVTDTERVTRE